MPTSKTFRAVIVHLNVIDSTGLVIHSGCGDYSNPEYRRWMGETCRVAFEKGYKVTTTPVPDPSA
jgi:hypothetical protein